jgi:hypothetical protein
LTCSILKKKKKKERKKEKLKNHLALSRSTQKQEPPSSTTWSAYSYNKKTNLSLFPLPLGSPPHFPPAALINGCLTSIAPQTLCYMSNVQTSKRQMYETSCASFGFMLIVRSRFFIGQRNWSLPRQIVSDVAHDFSVIVPKLAEYRYRTFDEASS